MQLILQTPQCRPSKPLVCMLVGPEFMSFGPLITSHPTCISTSVHQTIPSSLPFPSFRHSQLDNATRSPDHSRGNKLGKWSTNEMLGRRESDCMRCRETFAYFFFVCVCVKDTMSGPALALIWCQEVSAHMRSPTPCVRCCISLLARG